jgi:hypothetical protein
MQVVFTQGDQERELELSIRRQDATVADLAAALAIRSSEMSIDGRVMSGDAAQLVSSGLDLAAAGRPPLAG